MTTISGIVRDAAGEPVAGRIVRVYRRDTGVLVAETVSRTDEPYVADPFWADTTYVMNFRGPHNSTTFTDESSSPKTATVNGSAKIVDYLKGIKDDVGYFDASSYLSYAADAAFGFGTGSYTVEVFSFVPSVSNYHGVFDNRISGAVGVGLYVGNTNVLTLANNSSVIASGGTIVPMKVQHLALCREGAATTRGFVDGAEAFSVSDGRTLDSSAAARIGRDNTTYGFPGFMLGARVTKAARYTEPFTPPPWPFPNYGSQAANGEGYYWIGDLSSDEYQRIVLDDVAGTLYNDLIDRVYPG